MIFIVEDNMGRKKKYKTVKEYKEARKKWARTYYLKNADKIKKKQMEKYYDNIQSNKSNK